LAGLDCHCVDWSLAWRSWLGVDWVWLGFGEGSIAWLPRDLRNTVQDDEEHLEVPVGEISGSFGSGAEGWRRIFPSHW